MRAIRTSIIEYFEKNLRFNKTMQSRVHTAQTRVERPSKVKYDPERKMTALQFSGKDKIKVGKVPVPLVTDPTDAVIKVTASCVCGSDLHLYHDKVPEMLDGDIMGHESVGIVDEVGPEVKNVKKGDRVVISSVIGCGQCDYCLRREWSCCDTTNTSQVETKMYGHHVSGLFGYSHLMGGYDGCQAEYVRVPFADVNLFSIPSVLTDKQALCVADLASTGYHGTELADVKEGDKVVIFGCGPVGLMAQMWSKFRGASRVIAIDVDAQRVEYAKKQLGVEVVNANEEGPLEAVEKLIPGGPDKIIECVGFRFPQGFFEKLELKLKLATDASSVVNLAIKMVRKNGKITLIGDYLAYTNHFNIGAMMEKHLTMNGGAVWPHNYYKKIFAAMETGKVDPTFVWTHTFPFSKGDEAYKMFDKHEDGIIKPLLLPDSIYNQSNAGMDKTTQ